MNEKIYLGFAGKYNMRMVQSLTILNKFFEVIKQYRSSIPTEKLEEYISNPYIMYNIKDIDVLSNIFNYCTSSMLFTQTMNSVKDKLDMQKEEEYIISFTTFNFLSEKVWPKVTQNFIKNINQKDNTNFILRLNIPLKIVRNLYKEEKESEYRKLFICDFSKWIQFHFLGNISKISDENENLTIYLDVKY